MDTFEQLSEVAQYIDNGIQQLRAVVGGAPCAGTGDALAMLRDGIAEQRSEIARLSEQMSNADSLAASVEGVKRALDELTKYGVLCGLPLTLAQQRNLIGGSAAEPRAPAAPVVRSAAVYAPSVAPERAVVVPRECVGPSFREITAAEYQTLPSVTTLLISIDDTNKYYQNLFQCGSTKISESELSDAIPITSSRLKAFVRALTSLNRVQALDEGGCTFYKLL